MPSDSNHAAAFDALLARVRADSGLTSDVLGRVLTRVANTAPSPVSQAEIARGRMLPVPTPIASTTVSSAVAALKRVGLLEGRAMVRSGAGRPSEPLALGSDAWAVIGVHVTHVEGDVGGLVASLWPLDLSEGAATDNRPIWTVGERVLPRTSMHDAAPVAAKFIGELIDKAAERGLTVLGAGIEIGGHVHHDEVIVTAGRGWRQLSLAADVARRDEVCGLPIVLENDVNARAVRWLYSHRYSESNFAVVTVFNDGVGAALVIDGRLYRGVGGSAGEIAHLPVEFPEPSGPPATRGFAAPCRCGATGHVETLVTPLRMEQELGMALPVAAEVPLFDPNERLTQEASVFRRAGTALGRGIAAIANLVNPGRVHLELPAALASPAPGTAASAYLTAVETGLNEAFSTAARDARAGSPRLTVTELVTDDLATDDTRAAAACVLDTLIQHARGRDGCDDASAEAELPACWTRSPSPLSSHQPKPGKRRPQG